MKPAWVVPDLAVVFSLFTLFYALVFYRAPEQLFRDSDTGWHIRAGEAILDTGRVQRTDPYSYSRPGESWFAWEWAADGAMGAAHRVAGLRGVAVFYWAVLGLCSWFWVRLHWAAGGNFLIVCAMAAPMMTTVQLHWLARPHVFGWVFLLWTLLLLERGRMRWYWALAISVVWANVHGSFFLLPVSCGMYGGWRAAGAAVLGSFVNPYGLELHRHLFAYLTDTELLNRVAEFQSFNFHAEGAWQVGAVLLLGMAGFVCAVWCGQWSRAGALLLFCAMGLRTARGLPVMALAALPLANGAITGALRDWPRLARRGREALDYGDRLAKLQQPLHGAVTAVVAIALLTLAFVGSPAGFPPKEFPVEAVKHLPESGGRLLAPDKFGGYLIYALNGRKWPVYFDGRSDFYGGAFMKEYVALVELRPGWELTVDKYAFTHALLPPRYSLAGALEKMGWKRLYGDETAVLLARNF